MIRTFPNPVAFLSGVSYTTYIGWGSSVKSWQQTLCGCCFAQRKLSQDNLRCVFPKKRQPQGVFSLKIKEYLNAKYGGRATTLLSCEAKAFGIPYPPPSGWLNTYGEDEISSNQAIQLEIALKKSDKPSAVQGLKVLESAWLVLKTQPKVEDRLFLQSKEWKRLRYKALKFHGNKCQSCGSSPDTGAVLNVDHILPRRLFPNHALQLENLQVLCSECNEGKGNWDMTSFKEKEKI